MVVAEKAGSRTRRLLGLGKQVLDQNLVRSPVELLDRERSRPLAGTENRVLFLRPH